MNKTHIRCEACGYKHVSLIHRESCRQSYRKIAKQLVEDAKPLSRTQRLLRGGVVEFCTTSYGFSFASGTGGRISNLAIPKQHQPEVQLAKYITNAMAFTELPTDRYILADWDRIFRFEPTITNNYHE